MPTLSIAEILNKACNIESKDGKVEWLRKHNSVPLRNILILMYDKKFEFNIPNTTPPYTPSSHVDSHGMLFHEARKLKYFVKGMAGENLHQTKREQLFIQMLESVDPADAKLLCQMIAQKPFKGLPVSVINEAFGNIINVEKKSKEDGEA